MRIFAQGWSDRRDGPGYRLIYYLKGCNFRCVYCGNPEGILPEVEVLFYPKRIGKVPPDECCDHDLHCESCQTFECVNVWRHPAFELSGKELSVAQIVKDALAARHMIDGVTFGGGEPCCQIDGLLDALAALRELKIHTAVESNAGSIHYPKLFGKVDYLISDLKAVLPEHHRRLTGVDHELVLRNLELAARKQVHLLIRIPLVPTYNTMPDELNALIGFLVGLRKLRSALTVQLLPLHHLAEGKYRALRREEPLKDLPPPDPALVAALARRLQDNGITILNMTHESGEKQ